MELHSIKTISHEPGSHLEYSTSVSNSLLTIKLLVKKPLISINLFRLQEQKLVDGTMPLNILVIVRVIGWQEEELRI